MAVLTLSEIDARLLHLENWQHVDSTIIRTYIFTDFNQALAFVNKVGHLANKADHHPDMKIYQWNKVEIVLSTHSAGGLTENDFFLADQIEKLYE